MTIPSRKAARDDLKAKIAANITTLQAAYAYLPKDIGGQSPVCTVESGELQYDVNTDVDRQAFNLVVGFWARRDGDAGSGMDAEAAENALDGLAQSLAHVLADYYNARFTRLSDLFYDFVDGVEYRIEFHYVEVEW